MRSLLNSIHSPEMKINPPKTVSGCPCGEVIKRNVQKPCHTRSALTLWNTVTMYILDGNNYDKIWRIMIIRSSCLLLLILLLLLLFCFFNVSRHDSSSESRAVIPYTVSTLLKIKQNAAFSDFRQCSGSVPGGTVKWVDGRLIRLMVRSKHIKF